MTKEELFLHLANGIVLLAFLFRDILWLRIVMILSSLLMIAYGYFSGQALLAGWEVLFLSINTYHIVLLFQERRPIHLNGLLSQIHKQVFHEFSERDFLKLWNFGRERTYDRSVIVRQGETPADLLFIVNGKAKVARGNKTVVVLDDFDFIAEMSFLTGQPASATVRADGKVTVRCWSQAALHDLESIDPPLMARIRAILGRDLSKKLTERMRS
ncbi:MAG: cyclic nucleotide-binding domain-containing protein [Leptospiraceae bacterium]|nr:cyclic nucleotide-binding domain-containing protein [Leptospiraceae bacterium]MCB1303479.1 cyclic nucleotide-binding domain-containing protein [Leptospiraceae bacterium]